MNRPAAGLLLAASVLAGCDTTDDEPAARAESTTEKTTTTTAPPYEVRCTSDGEMSISVDSDGTRTFATPEEAAMDLAASQFSAYPASGYRLVDGVFGYERDGRVVATFHPSEIRPGEFLASGLSVCTDSLDLFVPHAVG